MKFVVKLIIIGGGLSGSLGVSCSGSVFSAPVVSVSMSVVSEVGRNFELTQILEAA
jgi:hypothetical protein